MKRLLIVGGGGFGREMLGWLCDVPRGQREWEIGGFLDARPSALEGFSCDVRVLGDPLTFSLGYDDLLICAIGDPSQKLRICHELKKRGASFLTFVHPTAVIGPSCRIGQGCILCPGCVITANVTLRDFVILNTQATVGHDAVIGEGCILNSHCDVTGFSRLGTGVLMGSHSVVLPNVVVGDYATIGAGSVALRNVRPRTTVLGIPAKEVFDRQRKLTESDATGESLKRKMTSEDPG